jgi:hypothetical protein
VNAATYFCKACVIRLISPPTARFLKWPFSSIWPQKSLGVFYFHSVLCEKKLKWTCCIILLFHNDLEIFIKSTISFSILFLWIYTLRSHSFKQQRVKQPWCSCGSAPATHRTNRGSDPKSVHVGFVANIVAMWQVPLPPSTSAFLCQYHSTNVSCPF